MPNALISVASTGSRKAKSSGMKVAGAKRLKVLAAEQDLLGKP